MTSRYDDTSIGILASDTYRELFKKRDVKFIRHYFTPTLVFPTVEELLDLDILSHVWSLGDRFYKLADEYYNDPTLWWIIAWFNETPTESHVEIGDVVDIPMPLESILQYLDV